MKRKTLIHAIAVILFWSPAGGARADEVVAVVTGAAPSGSPVAELESLRVGRVIDLRPGRRIEIGYITSCIRESIVGGIVTVGAEFSSLEGGRVVRRRVECDGGRLLLSAGEARESSAAVFRRPVLIKKTAR